jgi:5-methylcytosine-specific restriction endonuclease McrA
MPNYEKRTCKKHGEVDYVIEGRGYGRCTKCRSENVARARRRMKARLVAEFGGKCARCGYNKYYGALEFHHLDPTQKSFQLSVRGLTKSFEVLSEEAKKCLLLCSNCHREVEAGM